MLNTLVVCLSIFTPYKAPLSDWMIMAQIHKAHYHIYPRCPSLLTENVQTVPWMYASIIYYCFQENDVIQFPEKVSIFKHFNFSSSSRGCSCHLLLVFDAYYCWPSYTESTCNFLPFSIQCPFPRPCLLLDQMLLFSLILKLDDRASQLLVTESPKYL